MKIIRERQRVTEVTYELCFDSKDCQGSWYGFECDEKGNVDISKLESRPAALENYNCCINGEYNIAPGVIRKYVNHYTEPAVGLCNHCGSEVHLDGFTNTCEKCETDYNMSGQELAPRRFWGEETGEHWSDCL
jgi:hypothetical protein